MIARLRGCLLEKQPPSLVVDMNGVGYEVLAPMTTFYCLPDIGQDVILHTHFSVSETAQQLFGFFYTHDRALFRQLIKVNGVGPKMALGILSGMESGEFVACVRDNNVAALVKVPGVGKKTAERLVIEMRDKLEGWESSVSLNSLGSSAATQVNMPSRDNSKVVEAESALVALGYKPVEASKAIAAVRQEYTIEKSEELIRLALKNMLPK